MKTETTILELEVDNDFDRHYYFPPIGAAVRGRCDFGRMAPRDPNAIMLTTDFPKGVPGQRIVVNLATKECQIVEPLHFSEWADCKKQIEKRNLPIPEPVENFTPPNLSDWLWAIHRGLRDKYIKVIQGELPKDLGQETARRENLDPGEQRIERLCDLIENLLGRLVPAVAR
jgi:hypothetical protein